MNLQYSIKAGTVKLSCLLAPITLDFQVAFEQVSMGLIVMKHANLFTCQGLVCYGDCSVCVMFLVPH